MAWADVPDKLVTYGEAEYAPDDAVDKLLAEYEVTDVADVPVYRQFHFEVKLDYVLGACLNLAASKAVRPPQ